MTTRKGREFKVGEVVLKMTDIDKRFSGVHALRSVCFELRAGEVHALMGENGAGKSTLMKVLCGIHQRDAGEIELFGKPVSFSSIAEAQAAGISMIHQELNMMAHLTVAQNIYIGREPKKGGIFIDDRKMVQDAKALFKRIGIRIDPTVRLGSLTVGKQQMVEIAKAISRDSKLLILDEPLHGLDTYNRRRVKKIIEAFCARRDKTMIMVTHYENELPATISDRLYLKRNR